jgi:hypothetical protein
MCTYTREDEISGINCLELHVDYTYIISFHTSDMHSLTKPTL